MHRHDLHASLLAAASANPAVTLRMAFTVASVSQRKREVEVVGEHGETLVGSALIGADGFRSTIRSTICPSARLDFAKVTATRTLVPVENAGKSREAAVGLWLSRGINVVHYPVRGGSHIAFVIIAAESRQEECEDAGPVQLPQLVQRLHPDLAAILDAGREWQKRPLYTLGPLPRWSDRRVTLIGDAAHPMLPHVAQGGVLALEDALILGDRVAAQPEEAEAFQSFEAVRRQRANSMQRVSRLNGRLYHMGPPLSWARNAVLRSLRSAWLMARYDWIYGWKAS
jgi:salicylate hydroxylase